MGDIKNEVLRYLGYKNQKISQELNKDIDNSIEECKAFARPKSIYKIFDIEVKENIILKGTTLSLEGKDIYNHLNSAKKCAVMAVTLGSDIDMQIRILQGRNITKSLILNAAANAYVEEICDEVEEKIRKEAKDMGLSINYRYSPGYGDFDISHQKKTLDILNAGRLIGLYTNESNILIPGKSVTAFIGLFEGERPGKRGCDNCTQKNSCPYRKDGSNEIKGCFKK